MYFKLANPIVVCRKLYLTLAILILALCLSFPVTTPAAGVPLKMLKNEKGAQTQIPQGLSPEEVDTYLAGLSDEQARQVLSLKLKEAAAKNTASAAAGGSADGEEAAATLFYDVALGASLVMDQIGSFFSDDKSKSLKWDRILNRLSGGKGIGRLMLTVLLGVIVLACGFMVQWQVVRLSGNLRQQILSSVALGKLQRLGRFISRLLLEAIGVGAFILTTFILFILIFSQEEAGYWIVSNFLITAYYLVIIMFAARVILSPALPALRLLPLQDQDAKFLHRWIIRISIVAAVVATPSLIFLNVGRSEALSNLSFIATGLSVIILMIIMIWQSRHRVAEAICAETSEGICEENSLRMKFGRIWHYIAILYVAGSGMFWLINVFLGNKGDILNLIAILFLIPIFIGLDQWVQRLLKMASGELPEVINLNGEESAPPTEAPGEDQKSGIKHFAPLIRKVFRIVLAALLFFIVLGLWGIDLPVGRIFAADALKIIMILILGFVIWEFTKSRIDRKLKEEMPDDDEEMEEGGAGGSRIGTLLMLLRKFILAIMVVMVSLIVLSSLGVNIGPLIAGAGVIGLAIGFGAQTLVKDIIAGVFFLMDDAFRVGDFIETSGTKGSVEHISLRSLRLRNARGPIHTIPFGSMGTVTNMSRDYIITKLDFRVRYDTNVDKVRKIIKKINKKIAKDPEMGPNLLDKIKSQGVRELDDSAMIMRLKFKSIPGEQFVIRREVYRMIQENFRDNGIEFAHRNVTVYLPPEDQDANAGDESAKGTPAGRPDKKIAEAAAAAGAAAIQAEEDAKKKTGV
jgi:moderate conductance mechanosensitive channel